MKILYISPHFDDVALSCGGKLLEESNLVEARILTLFSQASPNGKSLYDARLEEEKKAAELFGASILVGEFLDAPYRDPTYSSFAQIICARAQSDAKLPGQIADMISQIVTRNQIEEIYAPLGVGWHIDHQLAFEGTKLFQQSHKTTVTWYEDRPYALPPYSVSLRLRELGFTGDADEFTVEDVLAGLQNAYHLHQTVKVPSEWEQIVDYVTRLYGTATVLAPEREAKPHYYTGTQVEMMRVWDVLNCYSSQINNIYSNSEHFQKEMKKYSMKCGFEEPLCERYWGLD